MDNESGKIATRPRVGRMYCHFSFVLVKRSASFFYVLVSDHYMINYFFSPTHVAFAGADASVVEQTQPCPPMLVTGGALQVASVVQEAYVDVGSSETTSALTRTGMI